jgi:NADH pyrophosphatase NudC (nudix superfamily)
MEREEFAMSNVQQKLGDGLSKLQSGIEQGKQKLQLAQEISRLKRSTQDALQQKAKLMLELGELTYFKLRTGAFHDEELLNYFNKTIELDRLIYQNANKIHELTKEEKANNQCECGTMIQENAKFCGSCGRPVREETPVYVDLIRCATCDEEIPSHSTYCRCCGTRVKG